MVEQTIDILNQMKEKSRCTTISYDNKSFLLNGKRYELVIFDEEGRQPEKVKLLYDNQSDWHWISVG